MFTTNYTENINDTNIKMFAVCLNDTNDVVSMWVGQDEKQAEYDRSKYFMIELDQYNSPAYCPGKYNGKTFDKEY